MKSEKAHTPYNIGNTQNTDGNHNVKIVFVVNGTRHNGNIDYIDYTPSDSHPYRGQNYRRQIQLIIPFVNSYKVRTERGIDKNYTHSDSHTPQPFNLRHIK